MIVAQTIIVRDEEDILQANLEHHLGTGVDVIFAIDHLSVDGTPDILEDFARSGQVFVERKDSPGFDQARWVTAMARAAHSFGATWILNSDADEFWTPANGSFHSTFAEVPAAISILEAHRYDYVQSASDDRGFPDAFIFRDNVSRNAHGRPLPAKVAHRSSENIEVAFGNHSATAPEFGTSLDDGRIEIWHVPFRNSAQLRRKVTQGSAALDEVPHLGPGIGSTWRRLRDAAASDELDENLSQYMLDERILPTLITSGVISVDYRLRDTVRGHNGDR